MRGRATFESHPAFSPSLKAASIHAIDIQYSAAIIKCITMLNATAAHQYGMKLDTIGQVRCLSYHEV